MEKREIDKLVCDWSLANESWGSAIYPRGPRPRRCPRREGETVKINNDPFTLILKIVKKKYPKLRAKIFFVEPDEISKGAFGHTFFPYDGSTPEILISVALPVVAAVDVFAHELAHLIIGPKGGHGQKWRNAFKWINQEYCKQVPDTHEKEKNG